MQNKVLDVRDLSVSFSSFGETTNIVNKVGTGGTSLAWTCTDPG